MFLDASVIVAILAREPGFEEIVRRIEGHSRPIYTSPLARFEAALSLARAKSMSARDRKPTADEVQAANDAVAALLAVLGATEVTISAGIGSEAIKAAQTFGKIVGHEADLNFGDCFAYACAKAYRLTLVYKGNDFSKTDLR